MAFKHALTRDVAYESLPRRDRARTHAAVAAWIEDTAGDRRAEFLELLAHHYERAYGYSREDPQADPAELDGLRTRAFEDALLASRDARSKHALDRAAELADQALSLAELPIEAAQAYESLGCTFLAGYRGDRAWDSFRAGADVLEEAEPADPAYVARLCALAAEIPTRWPGSMRSQVAVEDVERYLERGMRSLPRATAANAHICSWAMLFLPWGTVKTKSQEAAERAGREAAAIARRLGDVDLESAAMDAITSVSLSQGLYGRLVPVQQRRLELVDRVQDPLEVGDIFAMAAFVDIPPRALHRGGGTGGRRSPPQRGPDPTGGAALRGLEVARAVQARAVGGVPGRARTGPRHVGRPA